MKNFNLDMMREPGGRQAVSLLDMMLEGACAARPQPDSEDDHDADEVMAEANGFYAKITPEAAWEITQAVESRNDGALESSSPQSPTPPPASPAPRMRWRSRRCSRRCGRLDSW